MPEYTDNLNLIKPLYEEWADVVDLNQNFDALDTVVSGKADAVEDGRFAIVSSIAPVSPDEDTLWYDKSDEVLKRWNGTAWVTLIFDSDGTYQNRSEKGQPNGYVPLNASGFVPSGHLDLSVTLASYQSITQKGQNNGYAPLNANGDVPATHIPTNLATYEKVAEKGQPFGYAPLDGDARIPPDHMVVDLSAYQETVEKGQANGYAPLDANGLVPGGHLDTGAIQLLSEKGAVGGYAPLGQDGKLPETHLTEHVHDDLYPRYVIHGNNLSLSRPDASVVIWIGEGIPINAEPWDPVLNFNSTMDQ